ncbi:MAG: SDR family oxidoreductase [Flavobacteriales bacterium]|nr:SDR family oxidoreductase [Flavobacteriales bacterium]
MNKTVLITGTSTGFGKLTAKKFQAEGWNVAATMRSPENENELNQLENVLVTRLDVTDQASITKAVQESIEKFGTIDVVVNNAGYGAMGPMEAATNDQIRRQMDVNFFGVIDVMKAVLPIMREKRSGTIVNVTSMGGRMAFPFLSMYHASKYAVEGLTESMQYELKPLGINLKLIEPGAFRTEFGAGSADLLDTSNFEDYQEAHAKFMEAIVGGATFGDAQVVAEAIYDATTDNSNQLRYLVGEDAKQLVGAKSQMEEGQFTQMLTEQMGLN